MAPSNRELLFILKMRDEAAKVMKKTKGAVGDLGAKTKQAGEAFKKAGRTTENFSARLKETDRVLKKTGMSARELAERTRIVNDRLKKTTQTTERFNSRTSKSIPLLKRLGASFKSMANRAKRAAASINLTKEQLDHMKRSAIIAGAAMALLMGVGVAQFKNFETGMIGIGKTTGIAGEELRLLGEEFKELALAMPVPISQLQEIGIVAGQLGIKGVENITEFSRVVGMMGVTTNLAGEEAALTIARLSTIMGEPISNAENLASALVALGNDAAASEREIAALALNIAQNTSQFKIGSAAAIGFGAALAEVGLPAEAVGTAIGRIFMEFNQAAINGGKELEAFASIMGTTAEVAKQAFQKDATNAVVEFVGSIGRLNKAGLSAKEDLETLGFQAVRVQKIIGLLGNRYDDLVDTLQKSDEEYEKNTALAIEAEIAFKSLGSSLTTLGNALKILVGNLGKTLAPLIRTVSKLVVGLTRVFESMPEILQNAASAVFIFSGALLTLIVPLGWLAKTLPLLTAETGLLTLGFGVLTTSLTFFTGAVVLATNAMRAFWASLGPVGWAILAIGAALVVGLEAWKRYGKSAGDAIEDTKEAVAAGVDDIMEKLKDVTDSKFTLLITPILDPNVTFSGSINLEPIISFDSSSDIKQLTDDQKEALEKAIVGLDTEAKSLRFVGEEQKLFNAAMEIGIDLTKKTTLSVNELQAVRDLEFALVRKRGAERRETIKDLGIEIAAVRESIAAYQLQGDARKVELILIEAKKSAMLEGNILGKEELELLREKAELSIKLVDAGKKVAAQEDLVKKAIEDQQRARKDLASVISKNLEEAIMTGKKTANVFRALLDDIRAITLRALITKPFENFILKYLGVDEGGEAKTSNFLTRLLGQQVETVKKAADAPGVSLPRRKPGEGVVFPRKKPGEEPGEGKSAFANIEVLFKDSLAKIGGFFTGTFGEIGGLFKGLIGNLGGQFKGLFTLLPSLFKNLLGGLGNLFSSMFGGGGGGGGLFGTIAAAFLHGGGKAGNSNNPTTVVSFEDFKNAKRYHSGSGGNLTREVPAILQAGERVLNLRETADYERGRDSPPIVFSVGEINVTVERGSSAANSNVSDEQFGKNISDAVSKELEAKMRDFLRREMKPMGMLNRLK